MIRLGHSALACLPLNDGHQLAVLGRQNNRTAPTTTTGPSTSRGHGPGKSGRALYPILPNQPGGVR